MTKLSRSPLTFGEIFELPVTIDVRTAARAFGVCPATAYKLIRLGAFPCEFLRMGHRYRIPTASVMRALGIEERPIYAAEPEQHGVLAPEPG
ncbi:helix-turn-helix domain-containing protein [Streptomyces sp. URMC 129]|uniref:helix-turn-helix domain-containing protein n=1 Tax=Streptomyces sp. URMC 129 TaxID=3423407 RepID=UPI003F198892